MRTTALKRHTEDVTERLIAALREGRAPWQQTWKPGEAAWPRNGITRRRYTGSNLLALLLSDYSDPRWAGFGQIRRAGGHVLAGEHGRMILIAKPSRMRVTGDETEAGGDPDTRPSVYLRTAYVFNFRQTAGLPDRDEIAVDVDDSETGQRLDEIVARCGVRIEHKPWARPGYDDAADVVLMPEPDRFNTTDEYRQTLIHELAHATAHPSRMNRWTGGEAGRNKASDEYKLEELRAEMTSMILSRALGLGNEPGLRNNEEYVKHWIAGLERQPETLRRISSEAQAICAWLTEGLEASREPGTLAA